MFKGMKRYIRLRNAFFVAASLFLVACSSNGIVNEKDESTVFGKVRSDFVVTDRNDYGCKSIDAQVLTHILRTGKVVTKKEADNRYSTTGCSIDGAVAVNGEETIFVYDYGGLMWFGDGMLLACDKECCGEDNEYCSYVPKKVK